MSVDPRRFSALFSDPAPILQAQVQIHIVLFFASFHFADNQ